MISVLTVFHFHRAVHRSPSGEDAPDGLYGKGAMGRVIYTWEERIRARRELARLASEAPELIQKMGFTMAEVDAELAKPFWRR